jgi:hypothetical protein
MLPANSRILEIGAWHYFKQTYPERTTLLWTGRRPPRIRGVPAPDSYYVNCTPGNFIQALRDMRAGQYDLVVAYPMHRPPWHPRHWVRSLAHEPLKPWAAFTRVFGVSWLRYARIPVPLVAFDTNDVFVIERHNFFLIDKADIFFKRELPVDRWQVLTGTAHPSLPTTRIRSNETWRRRIANIRPMAITTPVIATEGLWSGDFPDKTVDIFFAGETYKNSWVRHSGLAELAELRARGVSVDVAEERLPRAEFHRRLARAWLAWAPSGFGWQSYRAGEASQCLAVPLVDNPFVERHRPLLNGAHLFYYDVEPGGLARAAEAALADKERLRRMALAAREHVLAHHTTKAIVDFVIDEAAKIAHEKKSAAHG